MKREREKAIKDRNPAAAYPVCAGCALQTRVLKLRSQEAGVAEREKDYMG